MASGITQNRPIFKTASVEVSLSAGEVKVFTCDTPTVQDMTIQIMNVVSTTSTILPVNYWISGNTTNISCRNFTTSNGSGTLYIHYIVA